MRLKKLFAILAAIGGFFIAQNLWATCSNYTTYSDGQVLTAASLNSLQTNYTNCVNAVLDGDNFTGTMNWYSGADLVMYSDAGSTKTLEIDGASGTLVQVDAICDALPPGQTSNCGITYASDTLTITDADGSALSSTNYCCVGLPGATAGQNGTVAFTSAVSSTFGAASDTDGNTFGITSGVDWGSDMPMFIHVCRGSASNYWGFSRNPARYETGDAAGDMCQEGDTDCDAQGDLFIMTTGLTLASEVDMPCVTVGAFRAQWTAATTQWDGQTLGDKDGIGQDRLDKTFATEWTFPAGQNGNYTNYYWDSDASHDIPTYATPANISATYMIGRDAMFKYALNTTGAGNCTQDGGAGAVAVNFFTPLTSQVFGDFQVVGTVKMNNVWSVAFADDGVSFSVYFFSDAVPWSQIQENVWGDSVSDDVYITFTGKAF